MYKIELWASFFHKNSTAPTHPETRRTVSSAPICGITIGIRTKSITTLNACPLFLCALHPGDSDTQKGVVSKTSFRRNPFLLFFIRRLTEEAEQYTGGNSRTDYSCNIRTHSMHQQVVGRIVSKTYIVGDTC